jgi:hypothetical protein
MSKITDTEKELAKLLAILLAMALLRVSLVSAVACLNVMAVS